MGTLKMMKARNSGKRKSRHAAIDALLRQISQENAAQFEVLANEYYDDNPGATAEECVQIDILIHSQWTTQCLWAVENRIYRDEMDQAKDQKYALAEAWIKRSADFVRISQRVESAQKTYYKALHQLERLRKARNGKPAPAASKGHNLVQMPTDGSWVN